MNSKQQPLSQSSTSTSTTYTQGHSAAVVASHASRTVENSAAFLLPHLQPHFTVVDLGCGPGTITRGFCSYVPRGQVIGIDAAEEVIEVARSSSPENEYPNLSFRVGDITARLPWDDNSVDVVYTSQVLYHIPHPVRVIREALRILKPGGLLAMRETDSLIFHPANPGTELFRQTMAKAVSPGAQGIGSGRRIHLWAQEAGFDRSKMQVRAGATCHPAPDESKWWANIHVERLKGEIGRKWLHELKLVKSQDEIDDMIKGLEEWGDSPEAWYVALQGEVICWK
ncbi:uncharacterized protein Z520_02465 [Fonsecaea multimorphosa CBS 102226]|uniref:Methyltransferase domain-containing protein n=1 Tax=Fonsecaea multimorphosa CBS 102226 TaxID=1442371 RepID=A0A0D2IZ50_9EURO|nr:uncharacterized protein Z520_02465 [Fonsecaea multimorphosa CBS 102226]KIY02327.1 hypothetical protein Z520_02465 [Fonsecaea multimorphosa CBS 102226]OAL28971.1 hypothetical protein AYO22_02407 [Fonsecaea multimorphosa]